MNKERKRERRDIGRVEDKEQRTECGRYGEKEKGERRRQGEISDRGDRAMRKQPAGSGHPERRSGMKRFRVSTREGGGTLLQRAAWDPERNIQFQFNSIYSVKS